MSQEVNAIKEWLAKEPHLPKDFDDMVLRKFVHSCYGSLEQTKKCLEKFCTTRSTMTEVYTSRNPTAEAMKTAFSITCVANYEAGDQEIVVHQFHDPKLEKFQFYDILKSFSLQADVWIQRKEFLPEGHIVILDMNNYSLRMIPRLNIFFLSQFLVYLLEAMPVRVKHIFGINAPSFYDKLYCLVKPALPSNICNLIEFFPDYQPLHKYVDKKYLPKDYGGDAIGVKEQHLEFVDEILNNRNNFSDDNTWKADLQKRPKSNNYDNSMNGSFKTLCID